MYRRLILVLIVSGFFLTTFLPASMARDFAVDNYKFAWTVAQVDAARIVFHKQKDRFGFVLSRSPHGGLQSLFLSPSDAKAIGKVLLQAENYLQKQKKGSVMNLKDVVQVGDYKVLFTSRGGENFKATVERQKTWTASVVMEVKMAMEVGKILSNAEEMANYVNSRINL